MAITLNVCSTTVPGDLPKVGSDAQDVSQLAKVIQNWMGLAGYVAEIAGNP